MNFRIAIFCTVMACTAPSLAHAAISLVDKDDFKFTLQGYYKNLFFSSNDLASDKRYYGDVNRVRTEWDAKAWSWLSAKVIWDNEVIFGNYVQSFDFSASESLRDSPQMNLYYNIAQKKNFYYGQNFYRGYLKIAPKPLTFIAGRQKIDWGVARILSPNDLYTSLSTFALEPTEKVGADAANLTIPITAKTKFNAVYSANRHFSKSRTGAYLTQTIGRFDISALGGRFLKDTLLGFNFTGDVKNVGVRGEFQYDFTNVGKDFAQLVVGMDYGFANTFTFIAEYFFNGQANDVFSPTFFMTPQPTANQIQTQHSHFVATQMKYDITPLLTPSLLAVWDIIGSSVFIRPEVKYAAFSWMDLTAFVHLPVGKAGGDFTSLPNVYAFQLQIFY